MVELGTPLYVMRVQVLGPGNVFGWSALLDDQDTLFRVRAREHTTALQIDGATLKAHCRTDPAMGAEFLHRILRGGGTSEGHRGALRGNVWCQGLVQLAPKSAQDLAVESNSATFATNCCGWNGFFGTGHSGRISRMRSALEETKSTAVSGRSSRMCL